MSPLPATPIVFREAHTNRVSLFPIRLNDIWAFYKKAEACFWTSEEVDLAGDAYDKLSPSEQKALDYVLAFFSYGDGIVNETLVDCVLKQVECKEVRKVYIFQTFIESVHEETYGQLLMTYLGRDGSKLDTLQRAITQLQAPRLKAEWMRKWASADVQFVHRLVAFAIVEGVLFSASFAIIFWLKGRSSAPMPGLFFSNELISRDEGMHCEFAVLLHNMLFERNASVSAPLLHKYITNALGADVPTLDAGAVDQHFTFGEAADEEGEVQTLKRFLAHEMYPSAVREKKDDAFFDDISRSVLASKRIDPLIANEILDSALEVEYAFIDEALPLAQLGMSAPSMKKYVRFCADRLLYDLGLSKRFHEENPFPFMDLINLEGKTNFFEKRNSQYQLAGVNVSRGHFALDADF